MPIETNEDTKREKIGNQYPRNSINLKNIANYWEKKLKRK